MAHESNEKILVAVESQQADSFAFVDIRRLGAEEVGVHIRVLRMNRDWTQQQLAEEAGVSQKSISIAETSPEDCSLGVFVKIARALGVTVNELCDEPVVTIRNGHSRRLRPRDI